VISASAEPDHPEPLSLSFVLFIQTELVLYLSFSFTAALVAPPALLIVLINTW